MTIDRQEQITQLQDLLDEAVRPFLFELNNSDTREAVRAAVRDMLNVLDLADYTVVCDDSNNFPARLAENELWCDVAVKFDEENEFYYFPIRLREIKLSE